MSRLVALACCAGLGCGSSVAVGPLRYRNQDPVTLVNDRVPLAKPPASFEKGLVAYYFDQDLVAPTHRALTVGEARRAQNVNSLGDVPDSAWFQNRTVTPEELRRGPGAGGPDRSKPWRVVGVKIGGMAIGITFLDGRDERYVLKFDERNFPETESSADVIVQRLAWAFGYNVPDNQVVTFERAQLVLDPSAQFRTRGGDKRPMTEADLEKYLKLAQSEGGTFRALASRMIDGKILGGVEPEGVREGDANDRVPHELRRDLRGQRVLWAWVNHLDIKSQNALATFTDGKYVKWYTLDFGESLGVGALTTAVPRLGYRGMFSPSSSLISLATFGIYKHPWERQVRHPGYRGLGELESTQFDPANWLPNHNWRPTDVADRFDQLWAAEIMLRLTPAHVRAAVEAGQYSDRRTTEYVTKTLIERQHKLGRWALGRVAPILHVEVRETAGELALCFDDLWLRHGFGLPAQTRYDLATFDYAGRAITGATRTFAQEPRTCIPAGKAGGSHEGYTIVRIDIRRGGHRVPPAFVHVAKGPKGFRVIGLDRH